MSRQAASRERDVIVVGAGACGGWAAKQLTESGLSVILIEAGPDRDVKTELRRLLALRAADERRARAAAAVRQPIQSRCASFNAGNSRYFVDDYDNPYDTPVDKPFDWIRCRGFGGRTTVWNRISLRMSDHQLKAASHDGAGVDWPISYGELVPYYDRVERYYGLSGSTDHHPEIPDGRYSSSPALSASSCRFKSAVEARWPGRLVTAARQVGATVPKRGDAAAALIFGAGADAVADAKRTGRLETRADAVVSSVILDEASGRAAGVEFVDRLTKNTHRVLGRTVILCASALESTRILLNSATARFPDGLANSSGVLGHYLMDHVAGVSAEGRIRASGEDSGVAEQLYIPNFRGRAERPSLFLRGYGAMVNIGYSWPGRADWRGCSIHFLGEMLPRFSNRVALRRRAPDAWGVPTLRIECSHSRNERRMAEDQAVVGRETLEAAGYRVEALSPLPGAPGIACHEMGTARMGIDPRTSVLNRFNQCWDVPNLYVTDAAAFPSSGYQNPTLTMLALTARACDAIVRKRRPAARAS